MEEKNLLNAYWPPGTVVSTLHAVIQFIILEDKQITWGRWFTFDSTETEWSNALLQIPTVRDG